MPAEAAAWFQHHIPHQWKASFVTQTACSMDQGALSKSWAALFPCALNLSNSLLFKRPNLAGVELADNTVLARISLILL